MEVERSPTAKQPAASSATARETVVTWFGVSRRWAAAQARYFDHGETRKVVYGESSGLTARSRRARSDGERTIAGPYH
jgi:hypothetical protein